MPGTAKVVYFARSMIGQPKAITARERDEQGPAGTLTIRQEGEARWHDTARAAAAGLAVAWVESPLLDGGSLVGRYLIVSGWAYARGGVKSVEFSVAGRHRPATLFGRRPDAEQLLAGGDGEALDFGSYVDLGGVPSGRHTVEVRTTGGEGATEQRGQIMLDPYAVYRDWLQRRHRAGSAHEESRNEAVRLHLCAASDDLLEELATVARGDCPGLVVVDPGATLLPEGLERLTEALATDAPVDAAYGDGELQAAGSETRPVLRPGWSPERLLAGDIVGPVIALGRQAADTLLARREPGEAVGSVYQLALRLIDAGLEVRRIPEPLSRVRAAAVEGSEDDRAAVLVARRRGLDVHVRRLSGGLRDLRWKPRERPLVSVVIPSRRAGGLLDRCLGSLGRETGYQPLEVVVVDSSGEGAAAAALPLLGTVPGRSIPYDERPFDFSRAVNLGASAAGGALLVFLNDDTEIVEADWLERMVALAQLPDVGVVGAKLLYPDGSVQHGGVSVAAGVEGVWHANIGAPRDAPGPDGELLVARDCAAVTGACMLVRREVFDAIGGFDEAFPMNLGDTDLCLRARSYGARVLFAPQAVLVHHESATRGAWEERSAAQRLAERWGERYEEGDPVEHPALAVAPPLRPGAALSTRGTNRVPTLVSSSDLESDLAAPILTCDELAEDGGTVFAGNVLRLSGWAAGRGGPATVTVEVDGQAVPVLPSLNSPVGAEEAAPTIPAEQAGFEVQVDTSGWDRGPHAISILARDAAGAETLRRGTVDVLPHRLAPTLLGEMVAEVEAGRLVLACDEPALDGTHEASDRHLAVRGWAYGRGGVEAVLVSFDGRWRRPAQHGRARSDLSLTFGPDAGRSAFELLIDLEGVEEGEHWLAVVALGPDGQAVGLEGTVRTEPPENRPIARRVGPYGEPDVAERFVPEEFRGKLVEAEHQARYRWAARIAGDAEVLDAACGVGYGVAILAAAGARRVVGLDRSSEAVLNARERAGEAGEFVLGDLRRLPFEDASFDLVTCFEAIEHVVDGDEVLDELRRVLRPDGVLLVSSPNRDVFTPGNPHHVHEYTPEELRAALAARFAQVRLHRQQAHLASLLSGDQAFDAVGGEEQLVAEVRKLTAAREELYTVAVASDATPPELGDVVMLGGILEVREFFEAAWYWEERAIAAEADAAATRAERDIAIIARERAEELAEESERERQHAEAQLEAVRTSKSWQVTAPLRGATEAARRRRRA